MTCGRVVTFLSKGRARLRRTVHLMSRHPFLLTNAADLFCSYLSLQSRNLYCRHHLVGKHPNRAIRLIPYDQPHFRSATISSGNVRFPFSCGSKVLWSATVRHGHVDSPSNYDLIGRARIFSSLPFQYRCLAGPPFPRIS